MSAYEKEWNRNKIIIDNIFAYAIATDVINRREDLEPKSVEK